MASKEIINPLDICKKPTNYIINGLPGTQKIILNDYDVVNFSF